MKAVNFSAAQQWNNRRNRLKEEEFVRACTRDAEQGLSLEDEDEVDEEYKPSLDLDLLINTSNEHDRQLKRLGLHMFNTQGVLLLTLVLTLCSFFKD